MERVKELLTMHPCYGCGALPGKYHEPGCLRETCPYCGKLSGRCGGYCRLDDEDTSSSIPPDDRIRWDGTGPMSKACLEFGWYRIVSVSGGQVETIEDANRLLIEAQWDRDRKRFVRTSFTLAVGAMWRRGIDVSLGWQTSRSRGVAEMHRGTTHPFGAGERIKGYAFYTIRGKQRKDHGKDFALHFGQFVHPERRPIGFPAEQVGTIVCNCLKEQNVVHIWDGDLNRPIRIVTRSFVTLD